MSGHIQEKRGWNKSHMRTACGGNTFQYTLKKKKKKKTRNLYKVHKLDLHIYLYFGEKIIKCVYEQTEDICELKEHGHRMIIKGISNPILL